MINEILKAAFRDPRPYWIEESIGLHEEETFGVPSGHAQTATVLYLYLAAWFKKRWIWVLAIALVLVTCISRVYLGVHDIQDVIAGVLVGILILVSIYLWSRFASEWFSNRILGQKLLIALMIPFTLAAFYVIIVLLIGEPDYSVAWDSSRIDLGDRTARDNLARGFGGLIGLSIGFLLESSRVRFVVDGPIWKRALWFLLGVAIAFLLWAGPKLFLPEDPEWLDNILTIIRYLIVSLWVAFWAPMSFVRLRLADASPIAETTLKF